MSYLLCINCCHKFDEEKSYTLREVSIPASLTKSRRSEVLSFHQPVCPACGAKHDLLPIDATLGATRGSRPDLIPVR